MIQGNRIWCEQDFAQLYEEEPKVVSCQTYFTIYLDIQDDTINVKIPSTASEDVFKFLLYKAVFCYYLNQKNLTPLYKTAQICCFQATQNFNLWYRLWESGVQIPKNTVLRCISYSKDQSLNKYLFLATIEQNQQCRKILARSRRDGNYYNICEYNHQKTSEEHLSFLSTNFKIFQHPFLSRLCEVHKTSTHTYFIFEHSPFSLTQVLQSDTKLTKEQVYTCFVEFLMALIFLEQQQLFVSSVNLRMINFNIDGHLVINQKIVCFSENTQTERNRKNVLFLSELFSILISSSDLMDEKPLIEYETHVNFAKYLVQFSSKKKVTLKQILIHPWVQQKSLHHILSKNTKGLNVKVIRKREKLKWFTNEQIKQFSQQYNKGKNANRYFESYQIYEQTINQIILKKYESFCQSERSNKSNFQLIDRLTKTNSSTSKVCIRDQGPSKKYTEAVKQSPYCMVLRKQGSLRRKKQLRC